MNFEGTNFFKITALILLVFVFFYVLYGNKNESWEKVIKVIEKDEYHGIVTGKYIDKENHNNPIIILSNKRKISLYGNHWDLINIGDSLSKKRNTGIIEVFKIDTVIKIDQRKYLETLKIKK